MKSQISKSNNRFWIQFDAEGLKDAALLTDLATNCKTGKFFLDVYFGEESFAAHLSLMRRKDSTHRIQNKRAKR